MDQQSIWIPFSIYIYSFLNISNENLFFKNEFRVSSIIYEPIIQVNCTVFK